MTAPVKVSKHQRPLIGRRVDEFTGETTLVVAGHHHTTKPKPWTQRTINRINNRRARRARRVNRLRAK